jgi:hypothetical protein
MVELPEAYICHVSTGRVRLRIPSMRNDPLYFSRLEAFLCPLPGVEKVEANPLTGSVLVLHNIGLKSADDLKSVANYTEMSGLFKIIVPETNSAPLAQHVADTFAVLNERVKEATDGTVDIPALAFLGLLGVSIVQFRQGVVAVPAMTALWYASSILRYQLSKEKTEGPRVQEAHDRRSTAM